MGATRIPGKNGSVSISWTHRYPAGVIPYDGDAWDDAAWLDRLEEAYTWHFDTVEAKHAREQWAAALIPGFFEEENAAEC